MTHVPKALWPNAFQEGKNVADHVLSLNRKLGKFAKRGPDDVPTDRELALAACVNVFWAYKIGQEASAAARRLAVQKAVEWLRADDGDSLEPRRLAKGLTKILAGKEGDGFLALWNRVEMFLAAAQRPEYWKQFDDDPSTVIRALAEDLQRVAQHGDDDGEENEGSSEQPQQQTGERPAGAEGGAGQAHPDAEAAADGSGGQDQPGEDRAPEAIRGRGEGLEAAARGVQEPDQEPAGAGGPGAG